MAQGATISLLSRARGSEADDAVESVSQLVTAFELMHDWIAHVGRINWVKLDDANIKKLVAQGKTVFVDVTADWCLTCKANERLVLERNPAVGRIADTIAMRGDWTSPDADITKFLTRFGRAGVPLNVAFGPGSPSGTALPELLTPAIVTSAIDTAEGVKARIGSNDDG